MPEVALYTTDHCSFCRRAKALLEARDIAFREVFIPREDIDRQIDLSRRTGMATMPQVMVGDRVIGGWDELARLDARGALREALAGAG